MFARCSFHHLPRGTRITTNHTRLRCLYSTERPGTLSTPESPRPRVVFSGIQPTGIPHLGNYLGALSNWIKIQQSATPEDHIIYSIVGWHALTLPQDPKVLKRSKMDMLATLLAIGIDPKVSIVFHQDDNPLHMELAWILSCLAPMGKLKRMNTWKSRLADSRHANDESEVDESLLNIGLFTYPILQAADILAYRASHVPVGEDQKQHLELARDLAETFNRTSKSRLFPLPSVLSTTSCRVLSLKDPSSKMSKSAPDAYSRILLTDDASTIARKIKGSVTDSLGSITYDPIKRPGTSNLLDILTACQPDETNVMDIAKRYEGKSHGDLKRDVTDAVEGVIQGPRREFEKLRVEKEYLEEVARTGADRARKLSGSTLERVRELVGLS